MEKDFTRKITLKYIIALGIIAFLSVSSFLTVRKVIKSQETSAAVITVTSRQRFLSQCIAIYSLCLVNIRGEKELAAFRSDLLDAVTLLEKSHAGLIHGDRSMNLSGNQSPQVYAFYFEQPVCLDKQIRNFIAEANALAQDAEDRLTPDNPHLQYILNDFASNLVDSLNLVVEQLQMESEEDNRQLQRLEAVILGVTLCALVLIAVFIFYPMAREIQQSGQKLMRSEARTRMIVDNATEGIFTFTSDGAVELFNPASEKIFQYRADEVVGKQVRMLFADIFQDEIERYIKGSEQKEPEGVTYEIMGKRKGGTSFPAELNFSKYYNEGKLMVLTTLRDVTEKNRSNLRAAVQHTITHILATSNTVEDAAKKILQSVCEKLRWDCGFFWIVNMNARTMHCSGRWGTFSGETPLYEIFTEQPNPAPEIALSDTSCLQKKPVWIMDIARDAQLSAKENAGENLWHGAFGFPVVSDEEVIGVFEFFSNSAQTSGSDLAEMLYSLGDHIGQFLKRKQSEEQLKHLASHDPLTGLLNRRRFNEELESLLAHSRRYGTHGALMFLDLDNFKRANDTFGHQAGDMLLVNIAGTLKKRLRNTDIIARLGGDEFAVILFQVDNDQAIFFAEQLLESVSQSARLINGQASGVTVSIGVALFPTHNTMAESLISCADQAMYRAKEKGRNCVCVFDPQSPGGSAGVLM